MAAALAIVAVSCSKKETTYEQDSNTMLAEPEVTVNESASVTKPADQTSVAVPVDSANNTTTTDSAAAK